MMRVTVENARAKHKVDRMETFDRAWIVDRQPNVPPVGIEIATHLR
jgi:hypothetical protein